MQCKETKGGHGDESSVASACAGCDPLLAAMAGCTKAGLNPDLQFAGARDTIVRLIRDSATMTFEEKQMLRANICEMAAAFDALADRTERLDLPAAGVGGGVR